MTNSFTPANASFKDKDLELWQQYKISKSPKALGDLLNRMDPVIQSTVNKWSGSISRQALLNEAKLLAIKAFDSYDPNKGTALATHLVGNLAPISRIVYTYQNTARLPENITLKLHTYHSALEHLKSTHGREPSTDELHQELGWSAAELNRLKTYQRADLMESGPAVKGEMFYSTKDDDDDDLLSAIYFDLLPDEKKLMEMVTGFNGHKQMNNTEIIEATGMSQAQLSYKKTQLVNKINNALHRKVS